MVIETLFDAFALNVSHRVEAFMESRSKLLCALWPTFPSHSDDQTPCFDDVTPARTACQLADVDVKDGGTPFDELLR
jgi:hypothetical protein